LVTSSVDHVTATVTVFVTDVNDHAPTFPAQLVELTVSEAAPLDARLSLLPAVDYDLATNSVQVDIDSVRNMAFGCPLPAAFPYTLQCTGKWSISLLLKTA